MTDKATLRRAALARRDALEIDDRLGWDEAIASRALALPELLETAGPVSGYWPIRSEVDPRPILEELAARGVPTALPVVTPDGLVFRAWTPWEPLVPAGFGTLGPGIDAPALRPAVLLVPLSGFDRVGHRLGYGQGHYDRVLAARRREGAPVLAIGLAYATQEVPAVPAEAHDIPLDVIVTPEAAFRPSPPWQPA